MKLLDCPFGRDSGGLSQPAWVSAPCSIIPGCWLWIRARRPSVGLGKRLMRGRVWQWCWSATCRPHWPEPLSPSQWSERSWVHRWATPRAHGEGWGMVYPLDFGARQPIKPENINCNTCLVYPVWKFGLCIHQTASSTTSFPTSWHTFPRANCPFCLDLM